MASSSWVILSSTLLLLVFVDILRPTSGCNYLTNFKLERYTKGRSYEYDYWPEPEETLENAYEEVVLLIGGKLPRTALPIPVEV